MIATESSTLIKRSGEGGIREKVQFNPEILRVIGLSAVIVLLLVGSVLTTLFVRINGVEDTFDYTATYIYAIFGFNHTCTYLDFNPSKTVAALMLQVCTFPLILFTYLNHKRIENDFNSGKVKENVYKFSSYTWILRCIWFLYFYMVFVNSPDTLGDDIVPVSDLPTLADKLADDGWSSFMLHYIPYFFFLVNLNLMAIEQTWYNYQKGTIPFNFSKSALWFYNFTLIIVFIYYNYFIIAKLMDWYNPLGDTLSFNLFIMYLNDVLGVIMPVFFALCEWKGYFGTETSDLIVIEFYNDNVQAETTVV